MTHKQRGEEQFRAAVSRLRRRPKWQSGPLEAVVLEALDDLAGQVEELRQLILARLYLRLNDSLGEEDVRQLCFLLGVEYDDLGGRGKSDRVRELIIHLQRRGRVAELIEEFGRLRPHQQ
ncbi:MAG: hypothetical protein L0332_29960 [Chloroflexi bacterium]|nr:hypothetical protein [Chloroflexota bacterium]MCI0646434.1 hypothetical protein [Chloroflexota bacterium]MCI0730927.1 hypothetical protein [Chloroflexota bacterium]